MIFKRKQNYRYIHLPVTATADSVGVKLKSGDYRYVLWSGAVEESALISVAGSKAVKVQLHAYSLPESHFDWQYLDDGDYLLGYLLPGQSLPTVAVALINGAPKTITDTCREG